MEKNLVFLGDSITAWNDLYDFPPYKNYGVPGYYSRDVLWLLEEKIHIEGKLAVLMIGVNDLLSQYPVSKVKSNISEIIEILNLRFERLILISILPTMYIDINKNIEDVNNFINDQKDIEVLDIYSEFLNEEGRIENTYSADGVHLSPLGYKLLNKKLKEKIEEENDNLSKV